MCIAPKTLVSRNYFHASLSRILKMKSWITPKMKTFARKKTATFSLVTISKISLVKISSYKIEIFASKSPFSVFKQNATDKRENKLFWDLFA